MTQLTPATTPLAPLPQIQHSKKERRGEILRRTALAMNAAMASMKLLFAQELDVAVGIFSKSSCKRGRVKRKWKDGERQETLVCTGENTKEETQI